MTRKTVERENHKALKPSIELTPLYDWMRDAGISIGRFAAETGLAEATVERLRKGKALPNLVTAFAIERYTQGEVPAACWMGTMLARLEWSQLLKQRRF